MRYFLGAVIVGLFVYAIAPYAQKYIIDPIAKKLKKPYEDLKENDDDTK